MSLEIELDFDKAIEPQPMPAGRYPLQVTAAKVAESKAGKPQIVASLGFVGGSEEEQNAPNITHYISLPSDEDEPKSANFKVLLLKRFLVLFNVPFDSGRIDVEGLAYNMLGANANAEVELTEPDDKGNVYNRLKLPRIS